MERNGAMPVPVAIKIVSRSGGRRMKSPKRPLAGDLFTLFHVAQKIRHEAVLHPVEAEREAVVVSGRGSDGIGAGDFFAVGLVGLEGQPLPGDEAEARHAGYLEFEVLGLVGQRHGANELGRESLKGRHQLCR